MGKGGIKLKTSQLNINNYPICITVKDSLCIKANQICLIIQSFLMESYLVSFYEPNNIVYAVLRFRKLMIGQLNEDTEFLHQVT